MFYRSDLQRFPVVTVPAEEAAEPSRPATQDRDFEARQSAEAIRRAVLALPQRYREPVVLFYFHDMDVAAAGGDDAAAGRHRESAAGSCPRTAAKTLSATRRASGGGVFESHQREEA